MKLHERLYHLKVCEMDYTLLIKGIDKYVLDNQGGDYNVGDLVRFDNEKAFSENLFRITHIRRIYPATECHYILSLERIK